MRDTPQPISTTIDHTRRSVTVPRSLMPEILAVYAGERPRSSHAIAALKAGGLMATERLDPLVTTLVDVMTSPSLVITVEVAGAGNPRLATIWGTPRRAVVGMTDDRHRFDLLQIEPSLLPFHLAQTTGLTPQPRPTFTGGCFVSTTALSLAEELAAVDPSAAKRELASAGVPGLWVNRLLEALTHRRSLWTVESVWIGSAPRRTESHLSVLDAGSAGYWRLASDDRAGRVIASVTDFDDLMRRFAALLPGSLEV